MEKNLLPAAGKEYMGVISKAVFSLNKESMRVLFVEPGHIYIGKILWENTFPNMLCKRSIFLSMPFLNIFQEGKVFD